MSETQIAAAVREWLLDTGLDDWAIMARHDDRLGWVIRLDHPASAGLVFETARRHLAEAIAVTEKLLAGADELRVASAAPTLVHPEVVGGVRALTQAFDWSRTEVRAVARLLQDHGVLNEAEADWLGDWTGRPISQAEQMQRCRFCGMPVSVEDVEQGLAVQRRTAVAHHRCVFAVEDTEAGPHGWAVLDAEAFSAIRARGPISGA